MRCLTVAPSGPHNGGGACRLDGGRLSWAQINLSLTKSRTPSGRASKARLVSPGACSRRHWNEVLAAYETVLKLASRFPIKCCRHLCLIEGMAGGGADFVSFGHILCTFIRQGRTIAGVQDGLNGSVFAECREGLRTGVAPVNSWFPGRARPTP